MFLSPVLPKNKKFILFLVMFPTFIYAGININGVCILFTNQKSSGQYVSAAGTNGSYSSVSYIIQSTLLNLKRKYTKILFELHDDSNFQVFESSPN